MVIRIAMTKCVSKYAKEKGWNRTQPPTPKLILNQNGNRLTSIILVKRFKLILNMFPITIFCGIIMESDTTRSIN